MFRLVFEKLGTYDVTPKGASEAVLMEESFSLGVDTFTLYNHVNTTFRECSRQLMPPTVSILKLIKKLFDEDKILMKQTENHSGRAVRISITDTEYLDYIFGYLQEAESFLNTSNIESNSDMFVSMSTSLLILDERERLWREKYMMYRLKQRRDVRIEEQRNTLERKIQAILNES